jgi:hypothetical protein
MGGSVQNSLGNDARGQGLGVLLAGLSRFAKLVIASAEYMEIEPEESSVMKISRPARDV